MKTKADNMEKRHTQSEEWQELKTRFDEICNEQEKTYKPQFEAVFNTLCENDSEQTEIYNTKYWDMGKPLPDKADEVKIGQALQRAGFGDDEEMCTAFLRYANLVIEGKKIQQKGIVINAREQMEQHHASPPTVKGWKFKPIAIIAPVEFHDLLIDTVFKCANLTSIPDESIDVLLDELAMADAFNMKCSLTRYIEDLRRCRVILDKDSFFDRDKTRLLFATLKKAVGSIKDNTNKPETVKAKIADIIKGFDNIPVWGLFFQILTLQGMFGLLLELDLNEGDTGYNEAQSLCNWIGDLLVEKEAMFCGLPYGENDLKRLEPFCEYIISTETGQFVQKALFGNDGQSRPDEQHPANNGQHVTVPAPLDDKIFEVLPALYDILVSNSVILSTITKADFIGRIPRGDVWAMVGTKAKAKMKAFVRLLKPYFNANWYDAVCASAGMTTDQMGKFNSYDALTEFERKVKAELKRIAPK